MSQIIEERWAVIPEFPHYQISSLGRVYNIRDDRIMSTSRNNHGHVKITLTCDDSTDRYTRSVAVLVGEAFVEAPDELSNQIVLLDGDLGNVCAHNLVWRPRWYAWKYVRQFKVVQPLHFKNLPVRNVIEGHEYNSIVEAGMKEGLLFEDIWLSMNTGKPIYPHRHVFEVVERV